MKPWGYVFVGLVIAGLLNAIVTGIFFAIDPANIL